MIATEIAKWEVYFMVFAWILGLAAVCGFLVERDK